MNDNPKAPLVGNLTPGRAYAVICGLSTVDHPSKHQRARIRACAKVLLEGCAAAAESEAAA